MVRLKNEEEIARLRVSGARLAEVLRLVSAKAVPGAVTSDLDEYAEKLIRDFGDKPAFKGYRPAGSDLAYPATLCVSINDEIVHGIPSKRILKDGDIVSLDCGINHEGMFSDAAITVLVGKKSLANISLLAVVKKALDRGIMAARAGKRLGDIGSAISGVIRGAGFQIVQELSGHGVGFAPHEDPYVPNFGEPGHGLELEPGLVLAIEPMATTGNGKIKLERDGFCFTTADGKPSAHFEHTVLITEKGAEVLTK